MSTNVSGWTWGDGDVAMDAVTTSTRTGEAQWQRQRQGERAGVHCNGVARCVTLLLCRLCVRLWLSCWSLVDASEWDVAESFDRLLVGPVGPSVTHCSCPCVAVRVRRFHPSAFARALCSIPLALQRTCGCEVRLTATGAQRTGSRRRDEDLTALAKRADNCGAQNNSTNKAVTIK